MANDLARVHDVTPEAHRIANIPMQNPHGFGELMMVEYEPLFVAINAGESESYEFALPGCPGYDEDYAMDLLSGGMVDLSASHVLGPGESMVLDRAP